VVSKRLIVAPCILVVGISIIIVLMGRTPPTEPFENNTLPHLSVKFTNLSWGVQAVVTIDPYGDNGWVWENPHFDPGFYYFSMDITTPELCNGGVGIAMKNKSVMYQNITDNVRCDTCLYGVYAFVTNGTCWVVARIVEDSGDLPVDTGLDFSLEFEDGLVVYVQSPDGDLPEIDELCIRSKILYWGDQELAGGGSSTSILYRNETTSWCEPIQVGSRSTGDKIVGDLNASVLWYCRALGKDGTIYWNPVSLTYFGESPEVFLQPEDWP
jgi:hypothetical protein